MCTCGLGLFGSGLESGGPIAKSPKLRASKGKAQRAFFGAKKTKPSLIVAGLLFLRVGSRVRETEALFPPLGILWWPQFQLGGFLPSAQSFPARSNMFWHKSPCQCFSLAPRLNQSGLHLPLAGLQWSQYRAARFIYLW
jgi:hypothetical protein